MPTRAHHVAFVVTNYPPRSGGVEVHVQSVAHGLIALGMSATVVCLGDDPGVRDDDGVTVHTLRRRLDVSGVLAAPHPGDWRRVTREVLPEASWLSVHTRFFPMTWFGVGAGRRLGLPVLLTEHGSGFVHTGSAAVDAAARLVDHTAGR
ncbi:MAG: glycosyltransferase, partial [Candidatus Lutibacillus vidarii]